MALFMAIILAFVVPKVETDIKAKEINKSKSLTFAALLKARLKTQLGGVIIRLDLEDIKKCY